MRTQCILSSFDSTLNDLCIFHSVTLFEDSTMDPDRLFEPHPHHNKDKKSIDHHFEHAAQPVELPQLPVNHLPLVPQP